MPWTIGSRRQFNVQKFDALSGELIWSRDIKPPYHGVSPGGPQQPNPFATSANAIEIEPIRGTDDVILRLNVAGDTANRQFVFARVTDCGCVEWLKTPLIDFPLPTGHYTAPISMAALANGHTLVSEFGSLPPNFPGATFGCAFLDIAADGSGAQSLIPNLFDDWKYLFRLNELPGTNDVIALGFRQRSGPQTRTLQRRSQAAIVWERGYLETINGVHPLNDNQINVLAVSPTLIVCAEQWRSQYTADGEGNWANREVGIVLRSTASISYDVTSVNAPPESDVVAHNVSAAEPILPDTPTFFRPPPDTGFWSEPIPPDIAGAAVEFWQATHAAVSGGAIYVAAARVNRHWHCTFHTAGFGTPALGYEYSYLSGIIETRQYFLLRFDDSLNLIWQVETDNQYWGLQADADGVISGRYVPSGDPSPQFEGERVFWLERRDTTGALKWRQSYGSLRVTPAPRDWSLTSAGSLYVCRDRLAY
ncbi:MAG: hypothetical protein ACKV2Q_24715 [Planctomycetaceae bacterium]